MKLKINKLSSHLILATIILLISTTSLSREKNKKTPIRIESSNQSFDIQKNVITFTNNVVLTQGTIKINADKVIVTHSNSKKGKEIIDGYGNPVRFYQFQYNGKSVKGYASKIHYELAKNCIVLTGNACLEQMDSKIIGDKITYMVKKQKMQAYSKKGKNVITIIVPSQFLEKNEN